MTRVTGSRRKRAGHYPYPRVAQRDDAEKTEEAVALTSKEAVGLIPVGRLCRSLPEREA